MNIVIDPTGRVLRAGFCDFSPELQAGERQVALSLDRIPDAITSMRWNGTALEASPPASVAVMEPDPTTQRLAIWQALKGLGLKPDPRAPDGSPEHVLADVEAAHGRQKQ